MKCAPTQIFVPRRWATRGDVLSNLIGVLIGLFLYVAIGAAARRTDDA